MQHRVILYTLCKFFMCILYDSCSDLRPLYSFRSCFLLRQSIFFKQDDSSSSRQKSTHSLSRRCSLLCSAHVSSLHSLAFGYDSDLLSRGKCLRRLRRHQLRHLRPMARQHGASGHPLGWGLVCCSSIHRQINGIW